MLLDMVMFYRLDGSDYLFVDWEHLDACVKPSDTDSRGRRCGKRATVAKNIMKNVAASKAGRKARSEAQLANKKKKTEGLKTQIRERMTQRSMEKWGREPSFTSKGRVGAGLSDEDLTKGKKYKSEQTKQRAIKKIRDNKRKEREMDYVTGKNYKAASKSEDRKWRKKEGYRHLGLKYPGKLEGGSFVQPRR